MAHIGNAAFTSIVVAFDHHDGIASQQGGGGDPGPHDAAANDADFMKRAWCDPRQFGQLANRSLGKENMTQGLGLVTVAEHDELFALVRKAFGRALFNAALDGLNRDQWRDLAAGLFAHGCLDLLPLVTIWDINGTLTQQFDGARAIHNGMGKIQRRIAKITMANSIQQTDFIGPVCQNRFAAGDHGHGVFDGDKARQAHSAAGTGDKPKVNFG